MSDKIGGRVKSDHNKSYQCLMCGANKNISSCGCGSDSKKYSSACGCGDGSDQHNISACGCGNGSDNSKFNNLKFIRSIFTGGSRHLDDKITVVDPSNVNQHLYPEASSSGKFSDTVDSEKEVQAVQTGGRDGTDYNRYKNFKNDYIGIKKQ